MIELEKALQELTDIVKETSGAYFTITHPGDYGVWQVYFATGGIVFRSPILKDAVIEASLYLLDKRIKIKDKYKLPRYAR